MAASPTIWRRVVTAAKAFVAPVDVVGMYTGGGWRPIIHEPFAGAFQRNISLDQTSITAFSAVYACVALRARDIGKLRIKLMEQQADGIWLEVARNAPFLPVLRKPNRYQTRIQFLENWMTSKLLFGNTYVWKDRDARGVVRSLHVLDPRRVTVKVGTDGSVWYEIQADNVSGTASDTLPASEFIHDRYMPMFHPLMGVSPIFAACASATQGVMIQQNSQQFFANMSAPSGHLRAPGTIKDETAARLQRDFEAAKGGTNLGRLLVTGDGIEYEPFTMPAVEAQLIEQLRWTVEDVARCFGVPLHKIQAGAVPQVGNMGALDQAYYSQTLQEDIESIELLLDEGLGLDEVTGRTYGTELDLEGLLRMDPLARADRLQKLQGVMKVDEMRASENLPSTTGGNAVYLQQQNFSLAALAKRDAQEDPFASAAPKPAPTPTANDDEAEAAAMAAAEKAAADAIAVVSAFDRCAEKVTKELDDVAAA
jgi:HK97 family phage portal protein